MYIDHKDKGAGSKAEKVFILILSLLFLSMMSMEMISNYEPRKLSMLLFIVFWIPLLFLHEFGHAIMARVCDWEVKRTVIGMGSLMHETRLFGAPMEIRMFPLEGFVNIAPKDLHWVRIKHALIYFAGPGIELLVFLLIMLYLGTDQMFSQHNNYWQIALQSLAYAALVGAILNLIPLGIRTPQGTSPNDGLGILMSLSSSQMDYELWVRDNQRSDDTPNK